MAVSEEAMDRLAARTPSDLARGEILETSTGPVRVLGILPFVADISSTPRWHHLLFTEDRVLAVLAYPEPAAEAQGVFLPLVAGVADRYPGVRASLRLLAIPEPLHPSQVTAVIPYAMVRSARLRQGRGPQDLPVLAIRARRRTTWWFLQKEDESADREKTCYARDLLLSLLPFAVELAGGSDAPRPSDRHLRHHVRDPLPLLPWSVGRGVPPDPERPSHLPRSPSSAAPPEEHET